MPLQVCLMPNPLTKSKTSKFAKPHLALINTGTWTRHDLGNPFAFWNEINHPLGRINKKECIKPTLFEIGVIYAYS